MKEAAEHYGLKIGRGDMVCCPFHADRTPSMKLNEDYGNIAKAHSKDKKTRCYYYCKNTVGATGHKCRTRLLRCLG